MRDRVKTLLAAVLGAVLLGAAAASAYADEHAIIAANDEVQLDVTGRIASRCGFELATSEVSLENLARWTTPVSVPFELSCNTAFVMEFSAENGSLLYDGDGSFPHPILTEFAYTMGVQVEAHDALMRAAPLSLSTDGSMLVSGARIDSHGLVASGAASLTIAPGPRPINAIYAAGRYRERIEIRLTPK